MEIFFEEPKRDDPNLKGRMKGPEERLILDL
jgi:hypothetical protein